MKRTVDGFASLAIIATVKRVCGGEYATAPELLDLPDLVLDRLCTKWLGWDAVLALAVTSKAAWDVVLSHHQELRVVLLELVPLISSAIASMSLAPQSAMDLCNNSYDRYAVRTTLEASEQQHVDSADDEPRVDDGDDGVEHGKLMMG